MTSATTGINALALHEVSAINRQRCERWHPGFPDDGWTGSDWSNAMAGEAGETCNVVKKLRRLDFGLTQAAADTPQDLLAKLATEIGDTFLYLDLLAQHYGLDLARAHRRRAGLTPMDLSLAEQLHNLGLHMYHAAAAGSIHVPYLKTLHKRMSHPLVGDTVTYVGRSGATPYEPSTTGVLLRVDHDDTTGPRQATIAPLNEPHREMRTRYDSLIALPVVSNQPGTNDGWASDLQPLPVHLLRCVDPETAASVLEVIHADGWAGKRYGRNLLFTTTATSSEIADLGDMAAECHWATEGEVSAMIARIPGTTEKRADHG